MRSQTFLVAAALLLLGASANALVTFGSSGTGPLMAAASNPYHGRWIIDKVLGVVHFVQDPASFPTFTVYNYFSTKENRWRAARGVIDPETGDLNITHVMMYAYRMNNNLSVNATGGGVWLESCFSGNFNNVSTYPQVRWNSHCMTPASGRHSAIWSQLEVIQGLASPSVWHQYGTQIMCRQDHPQLFSDGASLKDEIEKGERKVTLTQELKAEMASIEKHQKRHEEERRGAAKGAPRQTPHEVQDHSPPRSPKSTPQHPENPAPEVSSHRIHGAKNVTKVHVVFTQHFDLGYTDFAYCVLDHYLWYILPGVALTAGQLAEYKYTTHPFILYTFFNCEELKPAMQPPPGMIFSCPSPEVRQLVQDTILNKQLVWHAFIFDGFNEMMGSTMFDYAFNYGEWLTRKFFPHDYEANRPTAIQQVDVPGLYQVQVSHMLERGMRGMYVGQNSQPIWGGALDSMPQLFQWEPLPGSPAYMRNGTQNPLLIMVHHLGYGGVTLANAVIDEGTGTALLVMCSNENRPSYTPQNIDNYLERVAAEFPNARSVKPSTYDAFIDDVRRPGWPRSDIPTVSMDVGDTWVRNSGGDPVRIKEMQSLRREFKECLKSGQCHPHDNSTMNAGYFLVTGCEHNWGLSMQPNSWEATVLSYEEKRGMVTSASHFMPRGVNGTTAFRATAKKEEVQSKKVGAEMRHLFAATGAAVRSGQCRWPTSQGGGVAHYVFGTDGGLEHLSFAQADESGKIVNTTLASMDGGKLATVLYVVHNTQSPTWGDPNPHKVLLKGVPKIVSITQDLSQGDPCTFQVAMTVNQSFYDFNNGWVEHARNIKDGTNGQVANDTLYLMSTITFHNPKGTVHENGVNTAQSLVDMKLSWVNLQLSDTSGFYNGYFSHMMVGNSLNVQFHPKVSQCYMQSITQGHCGMGGVGVGAADNSYWTMVALGQEYSPYNFHLNGTCQYHIADTSIYTQNAASPSGGRLPHVEVSATDVLLVLFGWNNGQFQSHGNMTTNKCVPDTSTGLWYNVWNIWNGNWCVGYPWKQKDGLTSPVSVEFSVKLRY